MSQKRPFELARPANNPKKTASVKDLAIYAVISFAFVAWYATLASFYTGGDIAGYSRFYDIVSGVIKDDRAGDVFSVAETVLEKQAAYLSSKEFLFGWVVMAFCYLDVDYFHYQMSLISLLVFLFVYYFRFIKGWPWYLLVLALASSYFLGTAIPAERVRVATIAFLAAATIVRGSQQMLVAGVVASFAHLQVGGLGLLVYVSGLKKISNVTYLMTGVLVAGVFLYEQFERKVVGRVSALELDHSVTSAILGTSMLIFIGWYCRERLVILVLGLLFVFGVLVGFSRLNMVIWLLAAVLIDVSKVEARLGFAALSVFLGFRMAQMSLSVIEDGTAFPG